MADSPRALLWVPLLLLLAGCSYERGEGGPLALVWSLEFDSLPDAKEFVRAHGERHGDDGPLEPELVRTVTTREHRGAVVVRCADAALRRRLFALGTTYSIEGR